MFKFSSILIELYVIFWATKAYKMSQILFLSVWLYVGFPVAVSYTHLFYAKWHNRNHFLFIYITLQVLAINCNILCTIHSDDHCELLLLNTISWYFNSILFVKNHVYWFSFIYFTCYFLVLLSVIAFWFTLL